MCGKWWLCTNDATLAFQAFQQCGFFAADVRARANTYMNVEGEVGAEHAFPEPTLGGCSLDGFVQGFNCLWVFAANIDVALACANGEACNGHAFKQHERVAFHQHAVGKGAAVAFVGVAHDVLRGVGCLEHGFPFDASRKRCATAAAQTAVCNFLDNCAWRHSNCSS